MGFWRNLIGGGTPPADFALASVSYDEQVRAYMDGDLDRDLASAVAAVYRARVMTVDSVSSIPLRTAAGSLLPAPNDRDTWSEFLVETMRSLTDHGDAYWRKSSNGSWFVVDPGDVTVRWSDASKTRRAYFWNGTRVFDGLNFKVLSIDRGPGDLTGMGPMQSDRIRGLLAEQQYADQYYLNNASPVGLLRMPGIATSEEAKALKDEWMRAQSTRSPAVLTGGIEWTATGFSATDSSWVEAHRTGVGDVALLFGIPGPLMGYNTPGASLTYQSIGDLHEQWWRETLFPTYAVRISEALTEVLRTVVGFDPEQFFLASLSTRTRSARDLIEVGFDPADAADIVGLPPMRHTGVRSVQLQPPNEEALSE